jgi:parallel beta-helix repeat protein
LYKLRNISLILVFVLFMFVLNGCIASITPAPLPKTLLKGQVMVPEGALKEKQVTGQALAVATVNIIDLLTGDIIATTTTDANGNYNVEVPAGGPYIVQASKGSLIVLDVLPVIQEGETKDLGVADATSTAQALIFQTMVGKGHEPNQIDLEAMLSLPDFSKLVGQVESALTTGNDPTTDPQINDLVDKIVTSKPPTGGVGNGEGVIVKPPIHNITKDKYYENMQEAIGEAEDNDILQVARGTFEIAETIEISKPIKIVGISSRKPILKSTKEKNPVFKIISDNVTIENFEITTNVQVFGEIGKEDTSSLILVDAGKTGITIKNNKIYALESGSMKDWTSRGICIDRNSNVNIEGNTIFNTRNGIIVRYSCSAEISNNTIYNTKGGIMNYTNSNSDAQNRKMSSNSWGTAHNEWDIIWNSGGGYDLNPEVREILELSKNNNNAYVVDRRSTTGNLTGNRSHVFVQVGSGQDTPHEAKGSMSEPFSTFNLGIEAVVPEGTVFLVSGNFYATTNPVEVNKSLTLRSLVKHGAVIHGRIIVNADNVTIDGLTINRAAADGAGIIIKNNKKDILIKNNLQNGNGIGSASLETAGIQVTGGTEVIIENNIITNNKGNGIWVNTNGGSLTVTNNTIEDNRTGINFDSHYDTPISITNNKFTNNRENGISIGQKDSGVFTINGNRFEGNQNSHYSDYRYVDEDDDSVIPTKENIVNNNSFIGEIEWVWDSSRGRYLLKQKIL